MHFIWLAANCLIPPQPDASSNLKLVGWDVGIEATEIAAEEDIGNAEFTGTGGDIAPSNFTVTGEDRWSRGNRNGGLREDTWNHWNNTVLPRHGDNITFM